MNLIIDVCVMIDAFENDENRITKKNIETITNLLKTRSDLTHILIGTKMKAEFLPGLKKVNKENAYAFFKMYSVFTSGEKAIKKNFEYDPKNPKKSITNEDKKFDKELQKYCDKHKELMKKQFPKFNDQHILYAVWREKVSIVYTLDNLLGRNLRHVLNLLHKDDYVLEKCYNEEDLIW